MGGDPFTVEIFLRSEHEGDDDWLVGSVYNFSSAQEGCENCARQEQSRALSSGQVILTGALQTKFKDPGSAFKDGDKDKVVEFLKGKLVHRVLNVRRIPLALLFSRHRTNHDNIVYRLRVLKSKCRHCKFLWRSVI